MRKKEIIAIKVNALKESRAAVREKIDELAHSLTMLYMELRQDYDRSEIDQEKYETIRERTRLEIENQTPCFLYEPVIDLDEATEEECVRVWCEDNNEEYKELRIKLNYAHELRESIEQEILASAEVLLESDEIDLSYDMYIMRTMERTEKKAAEILEEAMNKISINKQNGEKNEQL